MLNKDEVEKMVKDAEVNAEEDKIKKEEVELRNNANSLVHASERLVKDLDGKMSEEDKTKLNEQKEELEKALNENAPTDKIKELQDKLQETMFAISSAAYQQAEGQEGQPAEGASEGGEQAASSEEGEKPADEDVIDAEFSK